MTDLSDLWADSKSSGKLFNIVATDFGGEVKKAVVSIEKKIYQLFSQLKNGGNFWASLRNFKEKICMNFTAADFARGLYFVTLTFNSQNAQLEFTRAP
ncbi:4251_t:CDS:2 [Paraglomus occultum]|uniref:4251_t:CDS:1 n=1 Tax=Paraglomus occultum TaxID=144539 RepID=A0A9N9GHZ8_9GLOM|nr:4251_t:CDS:2 [Paraglomus occultum]